MVAPVVMEVRADFLVAQMELQVNKVAVREEIQDLEEGVFVHLIVVIQGPQMELAVHLV